MRIEDMNSNQKTVLFLVLSAAWVGGLWYFYGRRPEEERTVVARLRNVKSISIQAKLQRGESEFEELIGDREGLANTFRVIGLEKDTSAVKFSVPVYDLNAATDQLICWVFPPDVANIGGKLYKIEPGFWPALLERAPKTKAWLDDPPKERPRGPGNRRPQSPPAEKKPVAKK